MKIAICTPVHGDVTAHYAQSLADMLLRTSTANIIFNDVPVAPDLKLFMRTSSLLPKIRNGLVEDAIDWGANYLLWVDSDHWFPDGSLLRLLSLNLPVVGVNYPTRQIPAWPTAIGLDGQRVWTTEELATQNAVTQVASLGLGFCLIDVHVLKSAKATGDTRRPLFMIELTEDGAMIGEDLVFFRRINEAGFPVHVDHALSWEIGHVHRHILYNSDALPEREE